MALNAPIIQGFYTALASAVRAATVAITGQQLLNPSNLNGATPEAGGLVAYLNISAVGTGTLQLVLDEQDPVSGVWIQVAATVAANAATLVRLKLKPSVTEVAASATNVTKQDILPGLWRLRVIHSDASNYTYSLGVVVYI